MYELPCKLDPPIQHMSCAYNCSQATETNDNAHTHSPQPVCHPKAVLTVEHIVE